MGKTYRYNPDEEPERGGNDASAEVRRKRKGGKRRGSQPQQEQPPEIVDLSWAVERMQEHVSFVVDSLVKKQLIVEDEREEYLAIFTAKVCQAGTDYDPNRKGAKSGKTSSPLHYMTMRVDAKLSNTMDYLAYRRWALKFLSITDDEDEAEGDEGAFVCSNGKCLSDECRGVRQLVFRMDVVTLISMLTEEERMTLAMRYEGYTDIEIAEALTLAFHRATDRHRVQKVHAVHIQEKARKCGFFPPSEARGREKI